MNKFDMFGRKIRHAILKETAGGEGGEGGSGGGTATVPEWLKSAPEEYQKDPHIGKYKTQEEYFKAEKNQRDLLGRKGVILPKENATPEERAAFFEQIGRPKTPADYKLALPEKLPEGLNIKPEFLSKFATKAHKWGMTQLQAQEALGDFIADVSAGHEANVKLAKESRESALSELKNEWGPQFDEKFQKAVKVIKGFGGEDFYAELGNLGNKPHMLKMFAAIGDMISEDKIPNIGGGGSGALPEAQEAQKQIDAINADPKHPYWDGNHKDHMKAVADMTVLFGKAHGKK